MKSLNTPARRPAFTLIELLTVVAIISLLISILLPSMGRARDQAKKASVMGMFKSVESGLEMFHNDFNQYPDSAGINDPIDWSGATPALANITGVSSVTTKPHMCGSHWLARALVGHDFRGVDASGAVMTSTSALSTTYAALSSTPRKPTYFDAGKAFVRDNDASSGMTTTATATSDFVPTGRLILADTSFKSPVLYYRANERASNAFTIAGSGIYRQADNVLITGSTSSSILGWDFASTSQRHQIAPYSYDGTNDPTPATGANPVDNCPTDFTNTFVRYLHNEGACQSTGTIRPMNPDRFLLISAGKDGIFGTDDDINNFSAAGK